MRTPRTKLKKGPVQLDMLAILDKPILDHETLFRNLWKELMNVKYIRANSQYTDFTKDFRLTLWQNYTDILSCLSDILADIGKDSRKYRHNGSDYYDKLTVDPDYLSVEEILSREEIYLFTRRAQGRIVGLIVANIDMLAGVKEKTDKVEATLARTINQLYRNL